MTSYMPYFLSLKALVAHFGVLRALTGKNFENAEVFEMDPSNFLDDTRIAKEAQEILKF